MAQLAPVQINKRRRLEMEMPPPPSPTALTLVKSLINLAKVVSGCGKPKSCQRRNASNAIRRIDLLLPFLEEIKESHPPLPPSAVMAFRELHGVMQRVAMLLDECRESSCFWLLLEQETYCQQFHELTESFGNALDWLPLELLELSEEVFEQTSLLRKQVLRARLSLDQAELQLREDVIFLIKQMERKETPELSSVESLFTKLKLLNARDCQTEISRLDDLIAEADECEVNSKTQNGIASLIGFIRYGKCVLYSALPTEFDDCDEMSDTIERSSGSRESGEVSTSGGEGDSSVMLCPPDEFLCPITLDLMRDPVIVATGQTYDRTSITKWLDAGNCTCPKSGQKLAHSNKIPNYCLRSLISQWCEDNNVPFEKGGHVKTKRGTGIDHVASNRAAQEATKLTAMFLVEKLASGAAEVQKQVVYEIRLLAKCGMENRMCIAEAGGIPLLVPLLSSSDPKIQEHAVTAMLNLSIFANNKKEIIAAGALAPIVEVLKSGKTMEARENAAATLFSLSVRDDLKVQIGNNRDAIPGLVTLLREGTAQRGKKDAASALFNLAVYHGNKPRIIKAGAVPTLLVLLTDEPAAMADDCLGLLALLAAFPEGVEAIAETDAIPILVSLLRSGSSKGRENATAVLLSLCKSDDLEILKAVSQISTAVPSLYNLLTMGTPRAKRKATSLIKLLHRWDRLTTTRTQQITGTQSAITTTVTTV